MEFSVPAPCVAQSFGPANNLLSTLITALITAHCNVSTPDTWPEDYGPKALTHGLDPYDFVIVGGGVAGLVVASRLSENPNHRVLVIEAGGDPFIEAQIMGHQFDDISSPSDWFYPTISNGISNLGLQGKSAFLRSGKMLGGSSGMGESYYLRGLPQDYDAWDRAGNPTWGYYDVLPFFRKSEDFKESTSMLLEHGIYGPVPVESYCTLPDFQNSILRIANDLGHQQIDDFVLSRNGFGLYHGMLDNGRRMNIATAFLREERPNLHVIKHAEATLIEIDAKKAANGVRFVYKETHQIVAKAKKEVIVAAGAIGSSKLLLLSGIGPSIHLSGVGIPIVSDLSVGDNFHDFLRTEVFLKFEFSSGRNREIEHLDEIYNSLIHRNGPDAISEVGGFCSTKNRSYPDIQFFFRRELNISAPGINLKPDIIASLQSQIKPDDRVIVATLIFLRPDSRGFVRLRSSDYCDQPFIIPNYLHKERDLKRTTDGLKELFKFEKSRVFRRLGGRLLRPRLPECDVYRYRSTKYFRCYVKYISDSAYNYVGTTKMGSREDEEAVVDPELRVRGVKSLRVIGASVIPKSPSSLALAATMMIAEKGSEMVKDTWRY